MRPILVATAFAALSLAACGQKDEASKPGVKVSESGVTVTGKDGQAVVRVGDAATRTDMPDFAPLYPGAKVESSVADMHQGDADGGMIVFTVPGKADEVLAFYKARAAAAGFKTQLDGDMGQARMFAASNETTKQGVQVIATEANGQANIQVIWARPKS
jgi:hypothetical protein